MKLVKSQITGMELVEGILSKSISLAQTEIKLTTSDVIGKPLIRTVFKGKDNLAFTFVSGLVKRFVDSFGFSTKMNESQIEMLSVDTFEKFQYESVEDVILFLKMCRSGSFGATNRGVDSNLIFGEWFPKYMEIKSDAREKEYEKEKSSLSIEQRGVEYSEVIKTYKKASNISFEKRVSDYVDRISKDMDRQMLEDTIIDWEKDPERSAYVYMLKKKRQVV